MLFANPRSQIFSRRGPNKAYLKEHVAPANYQTRIWKTANVLISEVPKPWEGHGWLENGEPLWCDHAIILLELLVYVPKQEVGRSDNENEDEIVECSTVSDSDECISDDD